MRYLYGRFICDFNMETYDRLNGSGLFIQIGAGAGNLDPRSGYRDGFTELVKSLPIERVKKVILVEPNPFNIPLLRECWKDYPQAVIHEIGIAPKSAQCSEMELYYSPLDGPHYHVASIKKEHVEKHYGVGCEVRSHRIPVVDIETFLRPFASEDIELLALDIEGIDAEVLFELKTFNMKYLSFEYLHLGDNMPLVVQHLVENNMKFLGRGVDHNGYDYLYGKRG